MLGTGFERGLRGRETVRVLERIAAALRSRPRLYGVARAVYRALMVVFTPIRSAFRALVRAAELAIRIITHPWFLRDLRRYRSMGGVAELADLYPMLAERTTTTGIDRHYFYQGVWAARCLRAQGPENHFDVGSSAEFVGILTAFMPVHFIDIRPLDVSIPNLTNVAGTILALPFEDRTIGSMTCLHVAEHIGLGRYGDPLDSQGTEKAAKELQRVVGTGGRLYVSVPAGRSRTQFNAHRVFGINDFVAMFSELQLVSFSILDDDGVFHEGVSTSGWDDQEFACGMFHFTRGG